MTEPLHLAVVGHTNTGKTSLLRTLTRDRGFGDVSPRPSTTRHVEAVELRADADAVLRLYDTPGMEDPIALRADIDARPGHDGPRRVEAFLASTAARTRYEQEAKVLRQVLASDAALYVIDARDPVLAKHRDELALLASCARPVLPVLNFVASPEHRAEDWRGALARLGLHAVVRFDTVAPPLDGERRLYLALAALTEAHRGALERLLARHEQTAAERLRAGAELVADLLVDVAACRWLVDGDADTLAAAPGRLRGAVRGREQLCVEGLLGVYAFGQEDVALSGLPLTEGRWEQDLFDADTLREAGLHIGGGAAAGAAAGLIVDLAVGGLTLGAAAALGAGLGGAWQGVSRYGSRLLGRLRGGRELSVDEPVLRLLAVRQIALLEALGRRGHAATQPLQIAAAGDWRQGPLPEALNRARRHPEWSQLNPGYRPGAGRDAAVAEVAASLSAASCG